MLRRMRRWCFLCVLLSFACDAPAPSADAGDESMVPDAGRHYVPEAFEPTAETVAYCREDDAEIEAKIRTLLAELSPREKIALLHGESLGPSHGVWAASRNDRLGIPGFRMLDGPRGLSRWSGKDGTAFPVAMMRGASWDPELEKRVGQAIARELRSVGANVLLAPTINLLHHPRWGRAQETYGEDSYHMGVMGAAFVEGVQAEGVIATVKHFAVNSIENTRHQVDVELDPRTLREVYLPHFRRAIIDAKAGAVMSAYNKVNGLYCDVNTLLLTDILRDEWGFAGFVVSDWLLGTHGAVEPLRAGLDLEMPVGTHRSRLRGALDRGDIEERELDRSVRRILRAQLCFGLQPRGPDDPAGRETEAHRELAREVAERGIVLLRNDGVLPLDRASTQSLAVLGRAADVPNIGDEGSSAVSTRSVVTAIDGLRAMGVEVLEVPDDAAVASADAVVVVTGMLAEDEGESDIAAGDRDSLALPTEEVELIRRVSALNERVIVVLEGGAAITVSDWQEEVEALLFAFYPGQEGGHAIARVLFGEVNPSGRLPFSIPAREEDLPEFDNTSEQVTYGYLHGYRWLDAHGHEPAYPFGHGLSYTQFTYDALSLSESRIGPDGTLRASVEVTNAGAIAGIETVQLYVRALESSVLRAEKDLRAFAQVALEPGETRRVTLEFSARDLAYWDGEWKVEPIEYEVRVGRSAADLPLTARFRIE